MEILQIQQAQHNIYIYYVYIHRTLRTLIFVVSFRFVVIDNPKCVHLITRNTAHVGIIMARVSTHCHETRYTHCRVHTWNTRMSCRIEWRRRCVCKLSGWMASSWLVPLYPPLHHRRHLCIRTRTIPTYAVAFSNSCTSSSSSLSLSSDGKWEYIHMICVVVKSSRRQQMCVYARITLLMLEWHCSRWNIYVCHVDIAHRTSYPSGALLAQRDNKVMRSLVWFVRSFVRSRYRTPQNNTHKLWT